MKGQPKSFHKLDIPSVGGTDSQKYVSSSEAELRYQRPLTLSPSDSAETPSEYDGNSIEAYFDDNLPSTLAAHHKRRSRKSMDEMLDMDIAVPLQIQDSLKTHHGEMYASLLFLNAAVMWSFYSVLAAQDFYAVRFPTINFKFYVTFVNSWPMLISHIIQITFGLDKKLGFNARIMTGFALFIFTAIVMICQNFIDLGDMTHAVILLVCMGLIGISNSLSGAPLFGLAGLFETPNFTHAVQMGSGFAAIFSVGGIALIRVLIEGTSAPGTDYTKLGMYIFLSIWIVICGVAMFDYVSFLKIPAVQFYVNLNSAIARTAQAQRQTIRQRVAHLWMVFKVIWPAAVTQFIVLLVSRVVYPGIPCSAKPTGIFEDSPSWYCSPGIIGSYSLCSFIGKAMVYGYFTRVISIEVAGYLAISRLLLIPPILIGVKPLLVNSSTWVIIWVCILGLSNGFLDTISICKAPLMVPMKDRETATNIMVLFLYMGIAFGSLTAFLIGQLNIY